ncbi:MAG TPA: tetratricopeptide repeat protein, partial [Edaphobacter sp.]
FTRLSLLLAALFFSNASLFADNAQAEALLKQGRVDEASAMLKQGISSQPQDDEAHLLLCRVYYAQEMADPAVQECETATHNNPSSSNAQMWLGRVYGLKASQSSMFSAFGVARKVRSAFERAVQLNPANVQAMSDLGQFYVEAPSIVGGGTDKAQALAAKMMPRSAAKAHRILGMAAKKKNDPATAESEFKSAIAAGKNPEAWIDLALLYQDQKQTDKAVAAIESSVQANRTQNAALVDAASILTNMNRQPELAEKLLRDYLASSAKTDDAPAFRVHLQLGNLLKQRGDTEGARKEYAAALSLASGYAPARKAAQGI